MSKQMLIVLLTLVCIGAIAYFYEKKQTDITYKQAIQTSTNSIQYGDQVIKKLRLNE